MERFYAIYCYLINRKQVNRRVIYRAWSEGTARRKFNDKRKNDPSIQEAGLYRAKDGACIDEYVGYF